ncbi:cAMP-regulated phosphoprotein 21-like isoform X2 [Telopea speciosissima]|uniref:cAMP-regulated phosphoprotein 21-like isoform X2 n=1 Tax=Telopea speciosissima TaxID=54955 RepID=UPI001CC4E61C|nr:cAMP-regulated phosphoprotein 21-like isoform X2 [Telopea speciosissima]
MESPPLTNDNSNNQNEEVSGAPQVDLFLKEALQNPRHRLTVLRMELDIQKFMENPDQHQFEFQHFPTSYLRLAAHRVAQHYGLQSMVVDNVVDGLGTRIVVRKTSESRYPTVCLSEVPPKQSENDKPEQVKIAIRPRPYKASQNDASELGAKSNPARTVEERKEEYDRARARIFSSSSGSDSEGPSSATSEGRSLCLTKDESEGSRSVVDELEKIPSTRDGSSRVAIFRDREKDRSDPDYDRSYERYVRGLTPNQGFGLGHFNIQGFQPSFVQYDSGFPQLPQTQTSFSYRPSSSPVMSTFCAMGLNPTSSDAVYMQGSSPAMMYVQSYEQFRHAFFQAPFYQQPLSFDYSQNH